MQLYMFLT